MNTKGHEEKEKLRNTEIFCSLFLTTDYELPTTNQENGVPRLRGEIKYKK